MIEKQKKYSISQVSKITGYEPHVLRYYEDDFNLDIPRTKSKRRYYTDKEIEKFHYIKELQEKGLSNKQIKLILDSPELITPASSEIAATVIQEEVLPSEGYDQETINKICQRLNDVLTSNLGSKLEEVKGKIETCFQSLNDEKEKEKQQNQNTIKKEKDVLICENARLKMKIKEKSYELVSLKEQLNRIHQKKRPFWKNLFKSKQKPSNLKNVK